MKNQRNHLTRYATVAFLAVVLAISAPALQAQDTLTVTSNGVGIGAEAPATDLDVRNVNGDSNTNIRFDNGAGDAWTNAIPTSSGNFIFNRQGSGGPEFIVTSQFAPGGTLVVNGTVNETSSRTTKTGFAAIDPVEMLAAVESLPVTSWRYKQDKSGSLHVGPVAEDFQRVFGLGDGKTISSTDARGVTLAAIQGLNAKVEAMEAKDAVIEELTERIAALEARLNEPSR